jgi:hypothetical protein
MHRPVNTETVFNEVAILKNGVATSQPMALEHATPQGLFSLHILEQAGALSDVTYTYSLCNTKGGTYITPSSATDIKANLIGASTDIVSFDPEVAKWMKIIATENNVAAVTSLTAVVSYQ